MAFVVDDLKTLITNIELAYENKMKDKMPIAEQKVNARILANACNALNHFIAYNAQQILPTTADYEHLVEHCAAKGIYPKRKTKASGRYKVKGTVGATVLVGQVLNRKKDNLEYIVDSSVILSAEEQEIQITCKTAGVIGNCTAGEKMSFAQAIAGVETEGEVVSVGAGADDESPEELLARYLQVVQNPDNGGNPQDYVRWALQVEGVSKAWAYPHEAGTGSIVIRIWTPSGPADAELREKVKEYIKTVCPADVKRIVVLTLIQESVDVVATIVPNTPEVHEAAEGELKSLFLRKIEPGMKIVLSKINEAISIADGEEDHTLISPTSDVEASPGAILVLGVVTWS